MVRVGFGVALLALLFLIGEFALPRLAEDRLRDELRPRGAVERVDVSAFPALKLLFNRADEVTVRMGETQAGPGELADLLASTERAGELDATATLLRMGRLTLRDLHLAKDGDALAGEASVTTEDVAAALPPEVGLRPVASDGGALVLEATAGPISVRARLSASDGALVIAPDGLLGGFAALTLFRDPRVRVTGVGAAARDDGYTLTAEGRLTGA